MRPPFSKKSLLMDEFDCFFISATLGSSAALSLKNYKSETQSMKRLKESIIVESQSQLRDKKNVLYPVKPILRGIKRQYRKIVRKIDSFKIYRCTKELIKFYIFDEIAEVSCDIIADASITAENALLK